METKVCLLVLCGIPGSGKSTICQKILQYGSRRTLALTEGMEDRGHRNMATPQNESLNQTCQNRGVIVISYDDLIPEEVERELIISDTPDTSSWKQYREQILNCVDDLLVKRTLHTATQSPQNVHKELWDRFKEKVHIPSPDGSTSEFVVVVDDNMYYSSMRYKYYQLARKYKCGFCQLFVDCSTEEALERNSSRTTRKIPEDVIVAMATKFEVPNPSANSWEKYSSTLKSDGSLEDIELRNFSDLFSLIESATNDPVQPIPEEDLEAKEISRLICSENMIHQADQFIRKLIGQSMAQSKGKGLSKSQMKALSAQLSDTKSAILNSLRAGEITVTWIDNSDATNETEQFHEKLKCEFEKRIGHFEQNSS